MTLIGLGACLAEISCLLGPGNPDHDRDLREAVEDVLLDHPGLIPSCVVVEARKGEVRLSGPVRSLYTKREASDR